MGCGTSSKPQAAASICSASGCEWTQAFGEEIGAVAEIVRGWAKGSTSGEDAKDSFKRRVLKSDSESDTREASRQAGESASQAAGALGALMGGLFGGGAPEGPPGQQLAGTAGERAAAGASAGAMFGAALGAMVGSVGAGVRVQELYGLVDALFGRPKKEARRLATETLGRHTETQEVRVDPNTGAMAVVTQRQARFLGFELDNLFHELVRQLPPSAPTGSPGADRLSRLELLMFCLCIEVIRQC